MYPPHRSATILVVDDSRTNLSYVSNLLRQGGFASVHTLTDPRETVTQCRILRPEVLILDYLMPHMNGLGVIDAIQAAGLEAEPAIIMLTGQAERDLCIEALKRGACDFVNKPCDRHELLARVGNAAQVQHLQRQLRQQNMMLEGVVTERTLKLQEAVDVLRQAERRLNGQLARSEAESRGKSEFMARAAHELRTPLNAILGFSDLIREQAHGPVGDPRYVEYATDIRQAAAHLVALIDDTLDLARADASGHDLEIREIDIGGTVQDSARMLRQMAEESGVKLSVSVPDRPLRLHTDPGKVRQIVLNLVSNAIKFTPRGGQVTVEVTDDEAGGAVIMVVRDTGLGMAAQDIPTALRPFGQVRRPGIPHPKGTGLGLPLTKRFVEMLGGALDIASKPGHGTVVTVRLPMDAITPAGLPRAAVD